MTSVHSYDVPSGGQPDDYGDPEIGGPARPAGPEQQLPAAAPDGTEAAAVRLLRPSELAAICRCTERTLRNWRRRGLLRPIRVGRTVYFAEADVLRLVAPAQGPRDDQ